MTGSFAANVSHVRLVCLLDYARRYTGTSRLDHKMTLFTFNAVTPTQEVNLRLERIRTLLQRLSRVRDTALEAELITQLTLETEAVGRVRATGAHATPGQPPISSAASPANARVRRAAAARPPVRARVRSRRRSAN